MTIKQKRISQPKYISIKPDILVMAKDLETRFHITFSALVSRLILEGHSKVFSSQLAPRPAAMQEVIKSVSQAKEIDPLS